MPRPKLYGELIAVRLWGDLMAKITRLAREQHTTKSAIVRQLLVKALGLNQEGQPGMNAKR